MHSELRIQNCLLKKLPFLERKCGTPMMFWNRGAPMGNVWGGPNCLDDESLSHLNPNCCLQLSKRIVLLKVESVEFKRQGVGQLAIVGIHIVQGPRGTAECGWSSSQKDALLEDNHGQTLRYA